METSGQLAVHRASSQWKLTLNSVKQILVSEMYCKEVSNIEYVRNIEYCNCRSRNTRRKKNKGNGGKSFFASTTDKQKR